jgi:hypothetical protein
LWGGGQQKGNVKKVVELNRIKQLTKESNTHITEQGARDANLMLLNILRQLFIRLLHPCQSKNTSDIKYESHITHNFYAKFFFEVTYIKYKD